MAAFITAPRSLQRWSRQTPRTRTVFEYHRIASPNLWRDCRAFSVVTQLRVTKKFDYDAVKPYSESLPDNSYLVDVREPIEYDEGHIPNSINIPIKSQPDAMLLPEEEFEDRFGFPKPPTDAETVFYCRAGVRSKAASQIAESAGYNKVGDYAGSWLDWTAKGGKVAR